MEKERQITISKTLSWILRHGLIKLKLDVDTAGFIKMDDLLKLSQAKDMSFDIIKKIVNENEKKRFELKEQNGIYMIRAVQGHSKKMENLIDVNVLLKKINEPLAICVHGTDKQSWKFIEIEGLKVMNRMQIHFASKLHSDEKVISGMRRNCAVKIYINMKKAMTDGIVFYMSSNEVILSNGLNGVMAPKYFEKVEIS